MGVGEGGVGWMAAVVGEEVCTEESRGERGPHWWKETFYSLLYDTDKERGEEKRLLNYSILTQGCGGVFICIALF